MPTPNGNNIYRIGTIQYDTIIWHEEEIPEGPKTGIVSLKIPGYITAITNSQVVPVNTNNTRPIKSRSTMTIDRLFINRLSINQLSIFQNYLKKKIITLGSVEKKKCTNLLKYLQTMIGPK